MNLKRGVSLKTWVTALTRKLLPVTSVSIVVGRKRLILPLQVDWAQRYDACHKILPRLSPFGVQQFINSITFSESAVDGIALENRVEIVNRALRFARQQDAALKKKGVPQEDRSVYSLYCFGSDYHRWMEYDFPVECEWLDYRQFD